ncbi:MAG: DUF547 domain-containing protein [Candidatus Schekmanbacteria bacterium]|nr:DUF547 domain-containing protein [Candidatus Schekmanbacteria bacterium]
MRWITVCVLLTLPVSRVAAESFDHSAWDELLKRSVVAVQDGKGTQVNYDGLVAERQKLDAYLAKTSGVAQRDFDAWPSAERLAFLINTYNARTVQLVLTKYPGLASIKDLGSFLQSPWKKRFFELLGATRSLDDIEHGMIRAGSYHEPRIHFAVNCASIGCPALRAEAFTGERLTAQLDAAARDFLADHSRNRLSGQVLEVSSIFKWYREDFEKGWGGFTSLSQFLASYAEALGISGTALETLKKNELEIDFLDYDWNLNRTK